MDIENLSLSQTLRFLSRAQLYLPCAVAAINRGGRDGSPRRDQDENGCQSVQEPAGIKQKMVCAGNADFKT
jgi:hypothetical protein